MITGITLPQRTPFDVEQVSIDGLKHVCFFFGPNGSGKTTISQLISDEAEDPASSSIRWAGNAPLRTYVYNRRFVADNFADKDSVKGVFTMGKGMVDAQKKIDELTKQIEKDRSKKTNAQGQLKQAEGELKTIETGILEACWKAKNAIPVSLQKHMTGYHVKVRFREGLLPRIADIKEDDSLPDMAEIDERATLVFDDSITLAHELPSVDFQTLVDSEGAGVFQKAIVGKEDIPIGALITRLGISDWVEKGRSYIEGDVCPFCQQHTVTEKLRSDLEDFFDETYRSDKEGLLRAIQNYENAASDVIATLNQIIVSHADFLDRSALKARIAELDGLVKGNQALLRQKAAEPSRSIELSSARDVCDAIRALLDSAATAVAKHNDTIKHRENQKGEVVGDLWRYAATIARPAVVALQDNEKTVNKRILGLNGNIRSIDSRISQNKAERRKVEASLTNVRETADAINTLLARFGFTSFRIVVAEDNKSYRIERNDGTPVKDTLSEGEASFLTFLYFYHLMSGSLESAGTNDKRVVVIDDPITSMDADILFVVSSLVRRLAKEAREGTGKTAQLIVLTHNITFHREITYVRAGEGNPKTAYYLIHKSGSHSRIEPCVKNPVNSTYELLWKDFFRDDCSPLTAQNTARRITETFFKLVGGPDAYGVITKMVSPDREIARSYMAWANAGSHSPFDDETYHNTRENIDVYRRVLKSIFDSAGYGGHYDEMAARYGTA